MSSLPPSNCCVSKFMVYPIIPVATDIYVRECMYSHK